MTNTYDPGSPTYSRTNDPSPTTLVLAKDASNAGTHTLPPDSKVLTDTTHSDAWHTCLSSAAYACWQSTFTINSCPPQKFYPPALDVASSSSDNK
jgi:hypothetical protein